MSFREKIKGHYFLPMTTLSNTSFEKSYIWCFRVCKKPTCMVKKQSNTACRNVLGTAKWQDRSTVLTGPLRVPSGTGQQKMNETHAVLNAYLCLSSVLCSKSADSCWMSDSNTGWWSGQGSWSNTWVGFTVSHTNMTRFKSEADNAWKKIGKTIKRRILNLLSPKLSKLFWK